MTASIFLSAMTVNSAKRVRMTNSPGRKSVSTWTVAGNCALSFRAPQGRSADACPPALPLPPPPLPSVLESRREISYNIFK